MIIKIEEKRRGGVQKISIKLLKNGNLIIVLHRKNFHES